jgi:replication-associated recombination protein RarA
MSWAIKYRPTDLDGLILHPEIRGDLEVFYNLPIDDTPNLLFYGQPGRGKTAVARIFSKRQGYGEVNFHDLSQPENQTKAAQRNIISIVTQQNTLRSFFSSNSGRHLFIIDEFHVLEDKSLQQQFNHALENQSEHHFIIITNREDILAANTLDRLNRVDFNLNKKELDLAAIKTQIPTVSRKILDYFKTETEFTDDEFLDIFKKSPASFRDYVRALEKAHYRKLAD